MIVLGLVGTPAGGKSTVAATLAELGATWIDADRIARGMLRRESIRNQLTQRFGDSILDEGGQIDRSKLADHVFGDDDAKRLALNYLESLVHPPTRLEIAHRLRTAASRLVPVAVLDVPLLFESGWDLACDEIWCVDAPLAARVRWAAHRGWDAAELRRREANQLAITEKKRRSNHCLENVGTRPQLTDRIEALYPALLEASRMAAPDPGHCSTD